MSDPNLEALRRDYTFKLDPANRCESCRHARPGAPNDVDGRCALLNIAIANVRKSACPGWQSAWGARK